jgi:RNA polymerase sigma-70 factor (ECF subfamily)
MDAPSTDLPGGRDFEHLALPYLEAVARFARSLSRNREDADDLVQETFLKAYRGWHTFDPSNDPRRWLFAICHNVFVRMRRRGTQMIESEDGDVDAIPAVMQHVAASQAGLGELFERLDVRRAVRRAVDDLPEPHRSILVLVDLEERTYEEAAAILGVPIGTVRSRLFRARRTVQEALLTYAEDMGLGAPRRPGAARVLATVPVGIPASTHEQSLQPVKAEVTDRA